MSPLRSLRLKVRAYLRRRDTGELVFARFRLIWAVLSNVFDFQNDFDDKTIVKELIESGIHLRLLEVHYIGID